MSKAVWAFHGLLIAFSAVCNRILPAALHLLCPTLSASLQDGDLVTALHVFNTWSDISSGNGSSQPSSHRTSADGASSVADDMSDTASDISGSHTASSIGQGPTGRVAAGQWCHTNSVNNKVLGIADATRQAPASVKPLSKQMHHMGHPAAPLSWAVSHEPCSAVPVVPSCIVRTSCQTQAVSD